MQAKKIEKGTKIVRSVIDAGRTTVNGIAKELQDAVPGALHQLAASTDMMLSDASGLRVSIASRMLGADSASSSSVVTLCDPSAPSVTEDASVGRGIPASIDHQGFQGSEGVELSPRQSEGSMKMNFGTPPRPTACTSSSESDHRAPSTSVSECDMSPPKSSPAEKPSAAKKRRWGASAWLSRK